MSAIPLKAVEQAEIAIDLLTPEDRAALEAAVSRLAGKAPEDWPKEIVRLVPGEPPFYELHFTPDMRAFVVPGADGSVEVEEIFHRGRLKLFQSPEKNGGTAE
jgi:hypothetical protein